MPENNARRQAISEEYIAALKETTPLQIPFMGHRGLSAYHIFPVLLPEGTNRKAFIDFLRTEQIQTSIHYPPIHQFQYYRQRYGVNEQLPLTETAANREVTLPLYPSMQAEQVEWVLKAIQQFFA